MVFSGLALAVTVWCQGLKWQLEINTLEFLWLLQSNFLECFEEKKNLNKKKINAIPICVQAVLDVDLIGPEGRQAEYAVLDDVDLIGPECHQAEYVIMSDNPIKISKFLIYSF